MQIERILVTFAQNCENVTVPEHYRTDDVWNFQSCDDRYGMEYPGRIPGQIEEQLISDNLLRRHLSDYQKVECGERLYKIERKKSEERQKNLAGTRPNSKPDLSATLHEGAKGRTDSKMW